jgi:hypothetical protein
MRIIRFKNAKQLNKGLGLAMRKLLYIETPRQKFDDIYLHCYQILPECVSYEHKLDCTMICYE